MINKGEGLRSQLANSPSYDSSLTLDKLESLFTGMLQGSNKPIEWTIYMHDLEIIKTLLKIEGFESDEINQLLNENKVFK